MSKLLKIPFYIPILGMIVGLALIILMAYMPNLPVLIAAVVIFHLCGWLLIIKFFVSVAGLFSTIVDPK
jgi:hypothetical protein